jgi:hypothetical protein
LKKQGGGAGGYKNWKKRWFVLDAEKITYYESEKTLDKSLGSIYLDEMIETKPELGSGDSNGKDEKDKKEKKNSSFYIQVPGRKLLLRCNDDDTVLFLLFPNSSLLFSCLLILR